MAGAGRPLPDQLHPGTADLRRDSQDVRGPCSMRRKGSCPGGPLRRALWPGGPPCRALCGGGSLRRTTLPSLGPCRSRRLDLEHDTGRRRVPISEEASRCRPRHEDDRRQHDRPCPATPTARHRRRRHLRPHRCGNARAPLDRRRRSRLEAVRGVGKQLPRSLGKRGIDEHELGADRSEVLDDWAGVHRDSLTSTSGRWDGPVGLTRRPFFSLLARSSGREHAGSEGKQPTDAVEDSLHARGQLAEDRVQGPVGPVRVPRRSDAAPPSSPGNGGT